jgi:hypothetical protein
MYLTRPTTVFQMSPGYWQPSGKFGIKCQRVVATLWQIWNKMSEGIDNPLTNSFQGF